jgi:hypothetical protein
MRSACGAVGIGWCFGQPGRWDPAALGPIAHCSTDHAAGRNGGHPLLHAVSSRDATGSARRREDHGHWYAFAPEIYRTNTLTVSKRIPSCVKSGTRTHAAPRHMTRSCRTTWVVNTGTAKTNARSQQLRTSGKVAEHQNMYRTRNSREMAIYGTGQAEFATSQAGRTQGNRGASKHGA